MTDNGGNWDEVWVAWRRLARWHQPNTTPAGAEDEAALQALADIGLVRRQLEQTELDAVRAARRLGRSWAEIAVKLGVTRQSAWERWREIDEVRPPAPTSRTAAAEVLDRTADELVDELAGRRTTEPNEPIGRIARKSRRLGKAVVPLVIGMSLTTARETLQDAGLLAAEPDGRVYTGPTEDDATVQDQVPEPGAKVPPGSSVLLWTDRQGGAGVREPRRPVPNPPSGVKTWDERADEAVG
jgi:transcriptional regulator with XRE-family HTH domain